MNQKTQAEIAELRRNVDDLTARVHRLRAKPRHMSGRLFGRRGGGEFGGDGLSGGVRRARHAVEDHPGLALLALAAIAGAAVAAAVAGSRSRSWGASLTGSTPWGSTPDWRGSWRDAMPDFWRS